MNFIQQFRNTLYFINDNPFSVFFREWLFRVVPDRKAAVYKSRSLQEIELQRVIEMKDCTQVVLPVLRGPRRKKLFFGGVSNLGYIVPILHCFRTFHLTQKSDSQQSRRFIEAASASTKCARNQWKSSRMRLLPLSPIHRDYPKSR